MKDSKNDKITFKVTHSEKKFLEAKAEKNGMNLSEFVRARLIEDPIESAPESGQKSLTQIELDLIKSSLGIYNLVNLIAHKNLSTEDIEKANQQTKELLDKKGYKLS